MKSDSPAQLHPMPRHVAIVMDGNGRWATQRGLPRLLGHKEGVEALVRAVRAFAHVGVQTLTVYAFSTENWSRPESEVSGLMSLVPTAMKAHVNQLAAQGVRLRAVGDLAALSPKVRQAFAKMEQMTAGNRRITLNVAFNYGGRWDIVQACQKAMAAGLSAETLTEAELSRFMAMSYAPDPDLFIRTGGEVRLSNFLLWQSAYAELYFTDCLWPDFGASEIDKALTAFAVRERRFGDVGASGQGEGAVGGAVDNDESTSERF